MRQNFRARHAQIGQRSNDRRGFQIGPKIRVGGTLGKVGQNVKIAVGKAASNPILDAAVGLIPGVGPGIAAGLNVAGHVLDTSKGGIHTAGDVAKVGLGAGEAYLGGKLANGIRDVGIGGIKQGLMSVGKKILPGTPGMPSTGSAEDDFYNEANGVPGDTGSSNPLVSVGKSALSGMAPKNKDGSIDYGALLKLGIGAGTAYEGYKSNQQATDDRKKALDLASAQYNANAPLRAQATQGLQQTQRPDLSPLFADGNPYKPKPTPIVPPIAPSGLMTVGRRPMPTTGRRMF